MSKTIAVFGAASHGPLVARRFGREGFQVVLRFRNQTRLDAYTGESSCDGIDVAAGFVGNSFTDRDRTAAHDPRRSTRDSALIDVLEYAPPGSTCSTARVAVRDADAASFLSSSTEQSPHPGHADPLRVPPAMLERGDGAVLLRPAGQRQHPGSSVRQHRHRSRRRLHYLDKTLHADLAGDRRIRGPLADHGPGGRQRRRRILSQGELRSGPAGAANPADLADAMWDLYLKWVGPGARRGS